MALMFAERVRPSLAGSHRSGSGLILTGTGSHTKETPDPDQTLKKTIQIQQKTGSGFIKNPNRTQQNDQGPDPI